MGIYSNVRYINCKVELYRGSTLTYTFTQNDNIISFKRESTSDNSKFFGFGITQKVNLHLRDVNRELVINANDLLKVFFCEGQGSTSYTKFGEYVVTETHRDENTNEASVTAYDRLYWATDYSFNELGIPTMMGDSVYQMAVKIANKLGLTGVNRAQSASEFGVYYPANYGGTESAREILDDIAEITQTVYYIGSSGTALNFIRLPEATNYGIGKSAYFELSQKSNRKLVEIVSTTALGDNIGANTGHIGTTQYVRENGLWNTLSNRGELVASAIEVLGDFTIAQFDMECRGSFFMDCGSKLTITAKDGSTFVSYLLNDELEYDGALHQHIYWEYEESDDEATSNPATLGEVIKQTTATVDKANQKISLVVSDVEETKSTLSSLELNTSGISASVEALSKVVDESVEGLGNDIKEISNSVEAKMSAEDVTILINQQLSSVDSVTTSTGFKFDKDGLNITKSGSEISTLISEDGMEVSKNGEVVLTANNQGVDAVNLHATTYLIVGQFSRFEDYGEGRTGCFPVV